MDRLRSVHSAATGRSASGVRTMDIAPRVALNGKVGWPMGGGSDEALVRVEAQLQYDNKGVHDERYAEPRTVDLADRRHSYSHHAEASQLHRCALLDRDWWTWLAGPRRHPRGYDATRRGSQSRSSGVVRTAGLRTRLRACRAPEADRCSTRRQMTRTIIVGRPSM